MNRVHPLEKQLTCAWVWRYFYNVLLFDTKHSYVSASEMKTAYNTP